MRLLSERSTDLSAVMTVMTVMTLCLSNKDHTICPTVMDSGHRPYGVTTQGPQSKQLTSPSDKPSDSVAIVTISVHLQKEKEKQWISF